MTTQYVGRFAPSPTGPLHFGSLVAALASYLDARHHNGLWLLRMEDLDGPRTSKAAAKAIFQTLKDFGFHWDADVLVQSNRTEDYKKALKQLSDMALLFPCTCSRKQIQGPYQGTCRHKKFESVSTAFATRVKTDLRKIEIVDGVLGEHTWCLERDCGDFIVQRKDGLAAYQLAVVVDDSDQGITHVVRGADLLDSTPRQVYLQQCLGLDTPSYAHIPVILNSAGDKLSKQTGAQALAAENPINALKQAHKLLGQVSPPHELESNITQWLAWSARHWRLRNIPGVFELPMD